MAASSSANASKRDTKGNSLLNIIENYTALDLETTGLDPHYNDIIEIGATRVRNGQVVERFQSLVNPGSEIDTFITELTGITNAMLADAPLLETVLPKALAFIGEDTIVAHNANFDINFMFDSCASLSLPSFSNDFIDTMRMSRRLYPQYPHHRLRDLIGHFSLSASAEHRALGDADAAHMCYEYMKQYVSDNKIDLSALSYSYNTRATDITTEKTDFDESTPVFGKMFVFTGTLEKMIRKEAMQMVVDMGGICGDGVTKATNYLVLGNNDYCNSIKDGKSIKQKKAEQLKLSGYDIAILSEDVFYDMVSLPCELVR